MRRARELLVREAQGVAFTSDPRGMARGSRSDRSRRQYVDSPDGGWGWMIVLHFFLITRLIEDPTNREQQVNVFVMGTLKSFGFFFIAFQQEFLENAERTTWIGSIMSCLRLSAGPLGTVACGKLGEMGTAVLGALLVACGFLFTTMVNSVSLIYITLGMLVGLGFAFLYQSASIMIARYFKAKLSTAYAISRSGMGLTFALAPFIQLLLEQYGWRGITETVAQLMSGWLADQNYTRRTHYLKVYLLLCGVLTLISPLATTFLWLLVYAICFAVFCGGYLPLLLPVMVDMLGVHKVRSVYGLSMFFVGFGCLTGPPAAAWLYDVTQTYSSSFYLAGSGYLLSFLLLLFEPLAYRYQKSHQQVGSGES
uniref:monocarboxylate transporter 5 isoform X4 n=1 Tax=Myxine glutinosa TaxID=7769 RepID=UPI00358EBD60